MCRIDHEHDGRRRYHDDLEGPESDVGERGELVEAHVRTSRLV